MTPPLPPLTADEIGRLRELCEILRAWQAMKRIYDSSADVSAAEAWCQSAKLGALDDRLVQVDADLLPTLRAHVEADAATIQRLTEDIEQWKRGYAKLAAKHAMMVGQEFERAEKAEAALATAREEMATWRDRTWQTMAAFTQFAGAKPSRAQIEAALTAAGIRGAVVAGRPTEFMRGLRPILDALEGLTGEGALPTRAQVAAALTLEVIGRMPINWPTMQGYLLDALEAAGCCMGPAPGQERT